MYSSLYSKWLDIFNSIDMHNKGPVHKSLPCFTYWTDLLSYMRFRLVPSSYIIQEDELIIGGNISTRVVLELCEHCVFSTILSDHCIVAVFDVKCPTTAFIGFCS